jgi:hypothetical protein
MSLESSQEPGWHTLFCQGNHLSEIEVAIVLFHESDFNGHVKALKKINIGIQKTKWIDRHLIDFFTYDGDM